MGYKANIITSLITRFIGAFVTLGISVITARELGSEKLGEIALVVLAITISMLVSGILSGPPLVYFTPRKKLKHLLIPAYFANIICSVLVCVILALFRLYDPQYLIYAIIISVFQGFYSTNFYVLLGLEKLNAYNFIGIVQVLVAISGIAIGVYVFHIKDVESYFIAQAISFFIGFIITIPFVRQTSFSDERSGYKNVVKEMFGYGFTMQLASIFQQLNYRMSYYIIDWQLGAAKLGIFVLTMQIAEGVLMISRSIAVVLFSKTANLTEKENIRDKTNSTLKFTYISTFGFMLALLIVPVSFYEMVFSKDFSETKMVLWFVSPGILFLSIQTILSSYFSSVHKVYVNAIGSFTGLVVIAGTVWHLTMGYDLKGAAISNVASYLVSMLISLIFYLVVEKNSLRSILINSSDVKKYAKVFSFKKTT
jgi:O-antigen/teichoic acid export membrane protein